MFITNKDVTEEEITEETIKSFRTILIIEQKIIGAEERKLLEVYCKRP